MRHYENTLHIQAAPQHIFDFINDHSRLASHMTRSSWMMGGGRMYLVTDADYGQRFGSHIQLHGRAFGFRIYLDEVVTLYEPPYRKEWETVGEPRLIVIGHYQMGINIQPDQNGSKLTVFIDYQPPRSLFSRLVSNLFGGTYARWCVHRMLKDSREHFNNK